MKLVLFLKTYKKKLLKSEICQLFIFSSVATVLYGKSNPAQTVALPDCGPIPQPYPALLPASLDWSLEEKEVPDPFSSQVSVCLLIYMYTYG